MKTPAYITVLCIIFSFTTGFMFTGAKWKESFPIVKFQVNPNLYGMTHEHQIKVITDAADIWFNGSDSKFSFSFNGQATNMEASSPPQFNCSDDSKKSLREMINTVYSSSIPDTDCTAETCSLIWSCGDEVLHFDIRINGIETDLKIRMAKEFGTIAGLTRCAIGDTSEQCSAKSVNGQSNPGTDSIMHKFANLAQISSDDKAGMQVLYGKFNNPFPKTGPYILNPIEREMLSSDERDILNLASINTNTPAQTRESIGTLMTYVPATPEQIELETGKWESGLSSEIQTNSYSAPVLTSAEAKAKNAQEMNQFFVTMNAMVSGLSNEELTVLRVNSVIGIDAYYKLKDIIEGDSRIDPRQFETARDKWLELRQRAIDEQKIR